MPKLDASMSITRGLRKLGVTLLRSSFSPGFAASPKRDGGTPSVDPPRVQIRLTLGQEQSWMRTVCSGW